MAWSEPETYAIGASAERFFHGRIGLLFADGFKKDIVDSFVETVTNTLEEIFCSFQG